MSRNEALHAHLDRIRRTVGEVSLSMGPARVVMLILALHRSASFVRGDESVAACCAELRDGLLSHLDHYSPGISACIRAELAEWPKPTT